MADSCDDNAGFPSAPDDEIEKQRARHRLVRGIRDVVGVPNAGSRFDRRAGRASVVRREDWRVERKLRPETLVEGARFGKAVALRARTALVGSRRFREVGRASLFDL